MGPGGYSEASLIAMHAANLERLQIMIGPLPVGTDLDFIASKHFAKFNGNYLKNSAIHLEGLQYCSRRRLERYFCQVARKFGHDGDIEPRCGVPKNMTPWVI